MATKSRPVSAADAPIDPTKKSRQATGSERTHLTKCCNPPPDGRGSAGPGASTETVPFLTAVRRPGNGAMPSGVIAPTRSPYSNTQPRIPVPGSNLPN